MEKKLELTKEEFVARYPVGTHILWQYAKTSGEWLPGIVIEPQRKYPKFDPSIWFLLDTEDRENVNVNYAARFVGYKWQHVMKLAG